MKSTLQLLGKIDGAFMALAAIFTANADPKVQHVALLVGGIAGGLGAILNAVAFYVGAPAPVEGK